MVVKHQRVDKSKREKRFKRIFQAAHLNWGAVDWGSILSNAIVMRGDKYGTRTY